MAKSFNNVAILVSALCFFSLLGLAYGEAHFTVEGKVYCDTCRVQFITRLSEFMKGATVRLECRDREAGSLTFSQEAVTDANGTYHINVDGDHEEDICGVALLKSSNTECNEINNDLFLKTAARVSLTKDNGIVSTKRQANPLGFMKKESLPDCIELLRQLGFTKSGNLVP